MGTTPSIDIQKRLARRGLELGASCHPSFETSRWRLVDSLGNGMYAAA